MVIKCEKSAMASNKWPGKDLQGQGHWDKIRNETKKKYQAMPRSKVICGKKYAFAQLTPNLPNDHGHEV